MSEYEIMNIVANSYNVMAENYEDWRITDKFNDLLQKFVEYLPEKGKILDAGVGSGVPSSRYFLDAGMQVIGIDISDTMLKLAKKNVPEAELRKMNILDVDTVFPEKYFDGIISVFTLFHIPRRFHGEVFKKFTRILKSGGTLLINSGTSGSEGFSNFFGSPMFWSNHSPKKTLKLVQDAGLQILFEGALIRGGEQQYWIYARKI
ncbi:MAG: class I SAM-dependent methyltransferase [Candidatus Lokiarchaeota archaeon]|nr:class I SAM-dependent methyltransferase [Candidatus Lokiarchaeota archaeon]